jgi:hypothetical protein
MVILVNMGFQSNIVCRQTLPPVLCIEGAFCVKQSNAKVKKSLYRPAQALRVQEA